jgi:DNA-binding transcriptional LysR family regulator
METVGEGFAQHAQRLTDLLVFVKVVEVQGFSAASRELGIGKSTVSKHVQRLERTLSLTLLHRTTRRLSLTDAGRLLYEYAEPIARLGSGAMQALAGLASRPVGTLRMSASPAYAQHVLAPLLPEFLGRYPEVRVDLQLSDRYVDPWEDGVDLVIRLQDAPDPNLAGRPLQRCPFVVCAAPTLPRLAAIHAPSDLSDFSCLAFSRGGEVATPRTWRFRNAAGQVEAVEVRAPVAVNSSDVVRELVAHRMGVGLLPRFAVEADLAAGRLVHVLPELEPEGVFGSMVWALWPPHRHMAPRQRAMVDFLAERLGRIDP